MSLPYNSLSLLYDGFMDQVDYRQWAEYLSSLIAKFGAPGGRLLDLGCGTGTLTILFSSLGHDVIGVDASVEMLAVAADKGLKHNLSPSRWRCQDMRQLSFPSASFDLVVCACDGINYLQNQADLEQTLAAVSKCIKPQGLLLFDLHSEYKFRQLFDGGVFVQESDDGYCVWTSEYDDASGDCWHDLTIFTKHAGDLYRRSLESHQQHYFSPGAVKAALHATQFALVGFFGWGTTDAPAADSERWQVVARRLPADDAECDQSHE